MPPLLLSTVRLHRQASSVWPLIPPCCCLPRQGAPSRRRTSCTPLEASGASLPRPAVIVTENTAKRSPSQWGYGKNDGISLGRGGGGGGGYGGKGGGGPCGIASHAFNMKYLVTIVLASQHEQCRGGGLSDTSYLRRPGSVSHGNDSASCCCCYQQYSSMFHML